MANTSYLNLTNRVLVRINETEITQSDFASVRGVQKLAKEAINASLQYIYSYYTNWPFLYTVGSQTLTIGQEFYDWPSNFSVADWDSFYVYADGTLRTVNTNLKEMSYSEWTKYRKEADLDSGSTGLTVPEFVFEQNDYGFGVSPSPDAAYVVKWDYYAAPTDLSAYNDTSSVPANYDEVIIQGALWHMYMFRDNSEQASIAERAFMKRLDAFKRVYDKIPEKFESTLANRRKI